MKFRGKIGRYLPMKGTGEYRRAVVTISFSASTRGLSEAIDRSMGRMIESGKLFRSRMDVCFKCIKGPDPVLCNDYVHGRCLATDGYPKFQQKPDEYEIGVDFSDECHAVIAVCRHNPDGSVTFLAEKRVEITKKAERGATCPKCGVRTNRQNYVALLTEEEWVCESCGHAFRTPLPEKRVEFPHRELLLGRDCNKTAVYKGDILRFLPMGADFVVDCAGDHPLGPVFKDLDRTFVCGQDECLLISRAKGDTE